MLVDFGDDGQLEAECTSKPRGSKPKNSIQVTVADEDTPEMITCDMIVKKYGDEEEEEEGGLEFEEGDEVTFKKGRKTLSGVVNTLMDNDTAKIKLEGIRKLEIVDIDNLNHAVTS